METMSVMDQAGSRSDAVGVVLGPGPESQRPGESLVWEAHSAPTWPHGFRTRPQVCPDAGSRGLRVDLAPVLDTLIELDGAGYARPVGDDLTASRG